MDGVTLNAGSGGSTIATDEVNSVHYQQVQIVTGADGASKSIVTGSNRLPVDGSGVTQPISGTVTVNALPAGTNNIGDVDVLTVIPGTGATQLGKAVDSAAGGTDTGVAMLAIRDDSLDSLTPAEGDYTHLRVNSTGALHVTGISSVTANAGTNLNTSALALETGGNLATAATHLATLAGAVSTEVQCDIVGALPAGTAYIGKARLTDGTTDAEVVPLTGYNAQAVAIVDGDGAQITSFGGGTQYTEDTAAAANPVGNAVILVRDDSPGTITSDDGDNVAQRGTNYGAAYVQVVTSSGSFVDSFGGGSGGTAAADDADFTAGTTEGTPVMGVYESSPSSITDGDLGVVGLTQTRAMKTSDAAAAALLGTIDTDTGNIATSVAVSAGWDNAASDGASVSGDVAHDTADAGEPVKIGGRAIAHGTNPTAVAAADRTNLYANRAGVLFTIGGHPNIVTKTATVADADGAQTNAALVTVSSGTKIVVTRVTVLADGANSGDCACRVGFAAATLGSASASGVTGILLDHTGIKAGGGVTIGDGSGILGVGGDDEDVRFTCEDPAGGSISIAVSYYTIES